MEKQKQGKSSYSSCVVELGKSLECFMWYKSTA